jgi:hypothetical protein
VYAIQHSQLQKALMFTIITSSTGNFFLQALQRLVCIQLLSKVGQLIAQIFQLFD